jgi:RNA polymerase sigma-70 factor (ECF subfamily)
MTAGALDAVQEAIDGIYRSESRRVLATLIRLLGDFDLAEEALQDAFVAAAEQWPRDGVPANPRAWLVSTGRFRAVDRIRRRARFDVALEELARQIDESESRVPERDDELEDDRLRLIFTCCHPALAPDAQVAMALREVCGLTTEEIARAFLASPATVAQRIVRAKAKIRSAGIPYELPPTAQMQDRLETVLYVVYLVFTEGYAASFGDSLVRPDLSAEAIRLGRLVVNLVANAEALGLLALMLLQDSRRAARISPAGDPVLLPDQDRALWDAEEIAEGISLVERAFAVGDAGQFAIQAAIASVHAAASSPAATDWRRIVDLYDLLLRSGSSSVVELNRAVAVAMRDGPEAGLVLIDGILAGGGLADYHLAHAARADLLRRMGRIADARAAYERALELTPQDAERRFLLGRLEELDGSGAARDSRGWTA